MAVGGLKVFTTGVTAAATGVGALSAAATSAQADFEQLKGGIETLFGAGGQTLEEYAKASGKTVKEVSGEYADLIAAQNAALRDADNAYKDAGMSANAYMETVSSFAASLKQSTESELEAVNAANQAVVDMSDNANKMGTDMELIQNAYQGFAKQNYTMLDNLKLGYGGTKEEMARLLEDATKLSGVEYDINSLKDVYEAIHVIQEDLGIAGTTTKEASTTIAGSMSQLTASWENLMVAVANPEKDFDAAVESVVSSASTFVDNLLPTVETSINGVADLIESLFPIVMDEIPKIINDVLPNLVESGANVMNSIVTGLSDNFPLLLEAMTEVIGTLDTAVMDNAPALVEMGIGILEALISGISDNLPQITESVFQIIELLVMSFIDMLPQIAQLGLDLIIQLTLGIADALPKLIPAIVDVVLQIVETLLDNIDMLIDAAISLIEALADGLIKALPKLIDKAPVIIEKLLDAIIKNTPKLVKAALEICLAIGQGILDSVDKILEKVPEVISMLVGKFDEYKTATLDVGRNIVEGIWEGISMSYTWIQNKIAGWVDDVLGWIQKKLGINSPSTVMRDKVGKFMGQGVWVGFEEEDPFGTIENSISRSWDGLQNNFKATATSAPINYTKLGNAMADSLVKSGLVVKVGDREIGRVVREVIVYG